MKLRAIFWLVWAGSFWHPMAFATPAPGVAARGLLSAGADTGCRKSRTGTLAAEPRIGFLGDAHQNIPALVRALDYFRRQCITHIVTMGDLTSGADERKIVEVYSLLSKHSGLGKDHIFILPGNWELPDYPPTVRSAKYRDTAKILTHYGKVLALRPKKLIHVEIDGYVLALSHYPMHPVSERTLPPYKADDPKMMELRRKAGSQIILRGYPADPRVAVEVFAHTHYGYIEQSVFGHPIVNPGPLAADLKSKEQPLTVALFLPEERRVQLINLDSEEVIEEFKYTQAIFRNPQAPRTGRRIPKNHCNVEMQGYREDMPPMNRGFEPPSAHDTI